jgi:2-succinyl-6-hydroxy-2,4-cyclohexadiene-1-carboxylate synthase
MQHRYYFNYRLSGNKKNRKVLYLHGFMGSMEDWREIIGLLGDDYVQMTLDLPGHGRTQVTDPDVYQFNICVDAIVDLIKSQKFYPLTIVGYSMGGRLALKMAVEYPQLLNAVVIESAAPGIADMSERNKRKEHDLQLADQLINEWPDFLDRWYSQPLFNTLRAKINYDDLLKRRVLNDPARLALVLKGMGQGVQPSLWQNLAKIQIPVYLIAGEADKKYVGLIKQMTHHLATYSHVIIKGCGHNVHFEAPQEYVRALKRFIV